MTIRDSREFIQFGRNQLGVSTKDYYSKNCRGAFYRNRFHHIPTDGISCVNRNRVKSAESGVCLFGTNDRVIMRSLRRVASSGFEGVLYGSERPCCRLQCPCMGGGAEGRRNFAACDSSPFTKMSQLQLQPLRRTDPTPSRGAIAQEGVQIGDAAVVGEFVVFETETEETPFYIGQVTKKAAAPPLNYQVPGNVGVSLEFPRLKLVLEVKWFQPVVTSRGEVSTILYEDNSKVIPFLVPCHLLRVGKLKLRRIEVPVKQTRSGGSGPKYQYKLEAADKAIIYERCRVFD